MRSRGFSKAAVVTGLGALGLLLAACSSSATPQASSGQSSSTTSSGGGGATVTSAQSSKYGVVLESSAGRTLYMLTADTSTSSACDASCAQIWTPLATTGAPMAGSGVQASMLATITRSDGSKQVTYGGHPLYTFSGDSGSGQVNGEGITSFGGTWYVLATSGQPVKSAVAGSTSTTAGSGGGGGGYY